MESVAVESVDVEIWGPERSASERAEYSTSSAACDTAIGVKKEKHVAGGAGSAGIQLGAFTAVEPHENDIRLGSQPCAAVPSVLAAIGLR